MNLSYFKVTNNDSTRSSSRDNPNSLFFFDPNSLHEVKIAYQNAIATGEEVSMYTVPSMVGPWDKLPVIGHRPRAAILRDLSHSDNEEETTALNDELDSLARRFMASGRTLPLSAVAA